MDPQPDYEEIGHCPFPDGIAGNGLWDTRKDVPKHTFRHEAIPPIWEKDPHSQEQDPE